MKRSMLLIGLLFCVSGAWAAIVTDDFNRADQGTSGDGSLIGPNWVNSDSTNLWAISSGSLRVVVMDQPAVLYNTELKTGNIADLNFSLSADVSGKVSNTWSGVVFNYQNSTNFYVLRFKVGSTSYQLNRVVDGSTGGPVFASDAIATFTQDVFYTLSVTSSNAYEFDFTITEAGSSTVLNPTTTAVDGNQNFTGGYAGVYSDGGELWAGAYDNFSLEAIPESKVAVIDDFNRADQGSSSDGSLIGPNWVNSDSDDRWAINSGSLRSVVVTQPAVLYNVEVETGDIEDRSFTLIVDVSGKEPNAWPGIVFNYQNSSNFYVLRFKVGTTSYQLNRVVDGSTGGPVFASDAIATFAEDAFYTLTVTSTNAYEFDFTLTETGSSTVLNPITTAVDGNQNFIGGYAGVYADGPAGWAEAYDNFYLKSGPEPAPEYLPARMVGISAVPGGMVRIVIDAPSAAALYAVKSSTDLVLGVWGNCPHSDDGVNPFLTTNLSYSTREGTNEVIYIQTDQSQAFFGVGENLLP